MDQDGRAGSIEAVYGQGLPPDIDLESKVYKILALIFSYLVGKLCPIVNKRGKNDKKLKKSFPKLTPKTPPLTLRRV
jgi:hypothetical protein